MEERRGSSGIAQTKAMVEKVAMELVSHNELKQNRFTIVYKIQGR